MRLVTPKAVSNDGLFFTCSGDIMDGTLMFKFLECPRTGKRVRIGKCKRECEFFIICLQAQEVIEEYKRKHGSENNNQE